MKWELKKLDWEAKKAGMRRLVKISEATWWNGPGSRFAKADLDHVVAAEHLRFTSFGDAEGEVRGWPALATEQEQTDWIGTSPTTVSCSARCGGCDRYSVEDETVSIAADSEHEPAD